ncbi:MAG: DUF87 domain-containing protein [Clostridiales bacterium]|nr:DUF87 domain-containing protein [Clostridiales bacterium]
MADWTKMYEADSAEASLKNMKEQTISIHVGGKESDAETVAALTNMEPEVNPIVGLSYKEPEDNLDLLTRNLQDCLSLIDDELMKGYVTQLDQLPVAVPPEGKSLREELSALPEVQFFRITELVYQKDEFSVHKLAAVFHAISGRECTLILMIQSNGDRSDFYLGVRSWKPLEHSVGTMRKMLENILMGMFPGSRVEPYLSEELEANMRQAEKSSAASVTCVADFKQGEGHVQNEEFVQGLEKFVDSMRGRSYTAIFLADSIEYGQVNELRETYENIYTQLSPFADMQFAFSMNAGKSEAAGGSGTSSITNSVQKNDSVGESSHEDFSTGTQENMGKSTGTGENQSISDGKTHQAGSSDGVNDSVSNGHTEGSSDTKGKSAGISISKGFSKFGVGLHAGINSSHTDNSSDTHTLTHGTSHMDTVSDAISKTLTRGISQTQSENVSYGTSQNRTSGTGKNSQHMEGISRGETFSFTDTRMMTDTFGTSQGVTLNAKNRTLDSILDRIDRQIERIEVCESLGMWKFAAYFLGESAAETETAANIYYSLMTGGQSGIERSAVNVWSAGSEHLENVTEYLTHFCHPVFLKKRNGEEEDSVVLVDPSAYISTNELAIHMGLPRHSVKGLPVVEHADFGKEVVKYRNDDDHQSTIKLGNIFNMGRMVENSDVVLDVESLAMHMFVTGSTGSGKSNTVYHLLDELAFTHRDDNINFMVIEPAKGEYKNVFGCKNNVKVLGTNPEYAELLKINPFKFPQEVHVLEHVDRLVEIFNVCWPMYAAMPAVLKEAVLKAYEMCGWNLTTSKNSLANTLFPSFGDLLEQLDRVIDVSGYSDEVKSNYRGSLLTRVKSLTNGLNGLIFSTDEIDNNILFDSNVIVDLSRVGSQETKSLLMGILVMRLSEHRMAFTKGSNNKLHHITVLEEAHNLLKADSFATTEDGGNVAGKSVEMISNAIAEMRTYGEGFIIADQSPNAVDMSAIRNTNTKIIMRLPEENDRRIAGKSAALKDQQLDEIAKLPKGVAVVYQNDWIEPVLCKIDKFSQQESLYVYEKPKEQDEGGKDEWFKTELLKLLVKGRVNENVDINVKGLRDAVPSADLSTKNKIGLYRMLEEYEITGKLKIWEDQNFEELSALVVELMNCRSRVERMITGARNFEELNDNFYELIHRQFHEASDEISLTLSQCFMKDYSVRDEKNVELYSAWREVVKKRGGLL